MQKITALTVVLLSMTFLLVAKGTPAGTLISNMALIDYTVGGTDGNLSSNTDQFIIDRVVDIKIDWEDAAPIEVAAGDHDRVLTFLLTNLGNGDENITLGYEHNATSLFVPQGVWIYQDDGDGLFDPTKDSNISRVSLGADLNATLFLVGTIPDDNTTVPGNQSYEAIRASSDSNATPGADRQHQLDVVIRQGVDVDTGSWVVRNYWLVTDKNATIHSEDNATHTGTRITYTIDCYIDGNVTGKTISNMVVTDNIPANTRYVPGSLRLDAAALTDAVDGDHGECNTTQITVRVGTLSGSGHKKVHFDVEVE